MPAAFYHIKDSVAGGIGKGATKPLFTVGGGTGKKKGYYTLIGEITAKFPGGVVADPTQASLSITFRGRTITGRSFQNTWTVPGAFPGSKFANGRWTNDHFFLSVYFSPCILYTMSTSQLAVLAAGDILVGTGGATLNHINIPLPILTVMWVDVTNTSAPDNYRIDVLEYNLLLIRFY